MLTTIYESPRRIFYPYTRRVQGELIPQLALCGFRYAECITTYSWMSTLPAFHRKHQVATEGLSVHPAHVLNKDKIFSSGYHKLLSAWKTYINFETFAWKQRSLSVSRPRSYIKRNTQQREMRSLFSVLTMSLRIYTLATRWFF